MPREQTLQITHAGVTHHGFLVLPDGDGPHAAVLVVHDLTGMREDTRRHCRNLAQAGYVALAPDLYPTLGCVVRTVARLAANHAAPELESFRQALADRPDTDAERIGIIGFCMGGGFALLAAADGPYAVAGPFYGAVPRDAERLEGLCPTIAQAGSQDLIFSAAARRLRAHLKALGVEGEVHVHPGVGHSFMNDHPGFLSKLGRFSFLRAFHDAPTEARGTTLLMDFLERHLGQS